jgi:immune inhibitor A
MKRGWMITLVVAFSIAVCGCTLITVIYGLGLFFNSLNNIPMEGGMFTGFTVPTITPAVVRPEAESSDQAAGNPASIRRHESLEVLKSVELPPNDFRDLAKRLEGIQNIPLTVSPPSSYFEMGSQQKFWVSNIDTNENIQINATLQYATDHVYFWVQEGVSFKLNELQQLVDTFENEIYPKNREFFGSEWTPGVDGDPHLYIIYTKGMGSGLAGYFSSADELHPLAHEYSNAHEAFVVSSDNVDLGSEYAYGVLAHEFQHMIHWFRDRNEASWVNEGFSELAVLLNGYEVGSEYSYIIDPDMQLNDWPYNNGDTSPHYGASFLFFTYFLDRFGENATKSLVANTANGFEGIDQVLEQIEAIDPITGNPIEAEDVFFDWVIASYLKDGKIGDGRFTYHNFPDAPQAEATETINDCPSDPLVRDVHQFGVDYLQINCRGNYVLRFEGSTEAKIVPQDPYSGDYYFWSNKGDEADMTLTKSFDFTNHEGPITLTYWTWYDLEEDYDYIYLEVSEDGEFWNIEITPSGTPEDPSGSSFGWGYNGMSGGWIQERVDLSDYAGKKIHIRFEYVTDAVANGEGMLIDDISIPEFGYYTDFEGGTDDWEANGWLRINNIIPQTYRVSLITFGKTVEVTQIPLGYDVEAEIPLQLDKEIDEAVLVVSGTTRFTRQKAAYQIEIQPE